MRIVLLNAVRYRFLATALFLFSSATWGESSVDPSQEKRDLDWVDRQEMDAEQQVNIPRFCCGAFLEPQPNGQESAQDPSESALRVSAQSTETGTGSAAILKGDVVISQGYRQITSDHALVDQENRQINLSGNVRFREPNMLLAGDDALLNLDSQEIKLKNVDYVLHEAGVRGSADLLRRQENGLIVIEDATYTSCEPGLNTWQLKTNEIKLDQASGFATIRNARLDVAGLPIFYFPYGKFPISDRRSSGLLFPSISNDDDNGIDFSLPIYLNLAPNYDATLTPRYLQHRGTALEAKFRHLSSWSHTEVSAGYLGNDKGGNRRDNLLNPSEPLPNQGDDRYIARLKHSGNFSKAWSSYLDINDVSDKAYFFDFGSLTDEEISPTYLTRIGRLAYQTDHWRFNLEAQDYQSITYGIESPYQLKSGLSIDGNYHFDNDVTLKINNQQSEFSHHSSSQVSGGRTRLNYNIGLDKRRDWGYLRPKIGLQHLAYQLNDFSSGPENNLITPVSDFDITTPLVSIDAGLKFEKLNGLFKEYKQTLEPRLFYINSNYRNQSHLPNFDTQEMMPSFSGLFSADRFTGGDRISDDHRLTLGLSTSYINKNTGKEKLRASIAQAVYFDDRKVTLLKTINPSTDLERKKSDIAFELGLRINNNWRLNNEVIYNHSHKKIEKGTANLYYRNNEDKIFNLGYRYSRLETATPATVKAAEKIDQLDLSFSLPMGRNFNWLGRWHHDFSNNRELELFTGFEYNNCCWRAGLIVRRWLDNRYEDASPELLTPKNGIFLQVQLRGLTGTGSRVGSILKKGIYGYEPMEKF
jgi:LPS-assembly protein